MNIKGYRDARLCVQLCYDAIESSRRALAHFESAYHHPPQRKEELALADFELERAVEAVNHANRALDRTHEKREEIQNVATTAFKAAQRVLAAARAVVKG